MTHTRWKKRAAAVLKVAVAFLVTGLVIELGAILVDDSIVTMKMTRALP